MTGHMPCPSGGRPLDCLNCTLPDCDESNQACPFWEGKLRPHQKYYAKKRLCPEFRKKHYAHNKKYRQTPAGKKSASECAMRWQRKNPEKQKAIQKRYRDKKVELCQKIKEDG